MSLKWPWGIRWNFSSNTHFIQFFPYFSSLDALLRTILYSNHTIYELFFLGYSSREHYRLSKSIQCFVSVPFFKQIDIFEPNSCSFLHMTFSANWWGSTLYFLIIYLMFVIIAKGLRECQESSFLYFFRWSCLWGVVEACFYY